MTTVTLAVDVTGDVIAVAFLLVLMPCLYIDISFSLPSYNPEPDDRKHSQRFPAQIVPVLP